MYIVIWDAPEGQLFFGPYRERHNAELAKADMDKSVSGKTITTRIAKLDRANWGHVWPEE